jgi:hypothetical protein
MLPIHSCRLSPPPWSQSSLSRLLHTQAADPSIRHHASDGAVRLYGAGGPDIGFKKVALSTSAIMDSIAFGIYSPQLAAGILFSLMARTNLSGDHFCCALW